MASVFLNISAALDNHLANMASVPPVAWENDDYEPVLDTLYLRPSNIQGDTLAVTEQDQTIGVYQIDIFSSVNVGKNESIVMADLIADRFKQDTTMTYSGQNVTVKNVNKASNPTAQNGWLKTTIDVVYYAFSARR